MSSSPTPRHTPPPTTMVERAVPLLIPPETLARPAAQTLPTPPLSVLVPHDTPLVLGLAAVDHSGRVRDRQVLAALDWQPGDHTHVAARHATLLIRRTHIGGVPIDTRGRIYIPAGARALLGITIDERIVLLAAPHHDMLIVYPTRTVTTLLAASHLNQSNR